MLNMIANKNILNYDYKMLMNLLYFIVDALDAIKKNEESQQLTRADRYKKNLLLKSLVSVEYLKNEISEYQENYNIRNDEIVTQSTRSPLNIILDALQKELIELDALSKNIEFVEHAKKRKYILSKAMPPLKNLSNYLGEK